MVDFAGATVRNKLNEYFAKQNHIRVAKNQVTKALIALASDLSRVIATLFSNDEPGFLFLADPETCFTDTAGTTSAEVGDPVALWLDQSGNGNHAEQPTSANRPILGRKPKGGKVVSGTVNFTEELLNTAFWNTRENVTVEAAPDAGRAGAIKITDTNDGSPTTHIFGTSLQVSPLNQNSVISARVKAGTITRVRISVNPSPTNRFVEVDLLTGVSINPLGVSVINEGDGWFRISRTGDNSSSSASRRLVVAPIVDGELSYQGDGNGFFYMAQPQAYFYGTTPPAELPRYQRQGANRFDVTEAGKPNRHYLFFGGASDPRWMQTPVITPNTDKAQVFVGLRKLSDAAGTIIETSTGLAANVGSINLSNRNFGGTVGDRWFWGTRGTAFAPANTIEELSVGAQSGILTGTSDINAPNMALRVDGQIVGEVDVSQGTGNFLAYPAYIGARAGTSLFLNGEISALTTRFGPNLDNNQIELVEKFTSTKVPEFTKPVIDGVPTIGVS